MPSDSVGIIACGCECGEEMIPDRAADAEAELQSLLANGSWKRCECNLCGLSGHGCLAVVSVLIKVKVSLQRGDRTFQSDDPVWCGDCSDHHLLLRRQRAVRNMQAKRKQEASASKEQPEKATCK